MRRRCVKFSRDLRRSGRMVDEDRAWLHAGEGAVGPKRHGAQIVVIADAGEHDFGVGRGFARRREGLPPNSAAKCSALAVVRL